MTLLTLNAVSVTLADRRILHTIDLKIEPGELVAIIGPNGAGKTSLLKACLGLIVTCEGDIQLGETPLSQLNTIQRAHALSYLPQDKTMAWAMSGADMVALGLYAWGGAKPYEQLSSENRQIVDHALSCFGVTQFSDRSVFDLSGGERARLHLARFLASRAKLFLADEPVAALDPHWQLKALQTLKDETQKGASVLISMHDLRLAERFADRILVLDKGCLIANAPAHSALTAHILKTVFGLEARNDEGFNPA